MTSLKRSAQAHLLIAAGLALVAGCGGDDTSGATTTAASTSDAAATTTGSGGAGGEAGSGSGGNGGATATTSTSSSGGGGAGGGAPDVPLESGAGFVMSYAAGDSIGIDTREPVSATFDAMSALTAYVWDLNASTQMNEAPTLGTNMLFDIGHTASIGWGRWSGGTMGGNFFGNTFVFGPDQGFHYVIAKGSIDPTLLAGSASFALVGATSPTAADGSSPPGSFTGQTTAEFGLPTRVGVQLSPTLGGVTYTIETTGFPAGSNEVATSSTTFGGVAPTTGGGPCGGACSSYVQGFFTDSGKVMAIAYQIGLGTDRISGTAVFAAP